MKTTVIALTLTSFASIAAAQDIYAGAGFDYALPHSGDAQTLGSVIAGVTFGAGTFAYGIEGDYGTTLDATAARDTARLRALGRYDFGSFAGFAAVGVTRYDVEGGDVSNGYSVGFGAELPIGTSLALRGEMIRDFMEDPFPTDVTTTRIGLLYQF